MHWRRKAHIIAHVAAPRRTECLDGEDLALLHLSLVGVPHKRYGLPAVNTVVLDIMCSDIPYWFDGNSFATDFNLVALHRFLDGSANIAHTHVDPSSLLQSLAIALALGTMPEARHLDPCVGGILDCS